MPKIEIPQGFSTISPFDGNMRYGENYAFYLRDTETKLAPTYYRKLIAIAKNKICIWDPYFHKEDTQIFANLSNSVEVEVLTKKNKKRKDEYLDGLINDTKNNINTSINGICYFTFGFIDTDKYGTDVWQCHDRFLIIDDMRYFIVGASIASHLEPHDSTGIYEVKDALDQKIIRDAYADTMKVCKDENMYKTVSI